MGKLDAFLLDTALAMREEAVNRVLDALEGYSIGAFLVAFLSNSSYGSHPLRKQFIAEFAELLLFFCSLAYLSPTVTAFCLEQIIKTLTSEVRGLVRKESGWHFSARNAQAGPILGFSLSEMAHKLEMHAPALWKVLSALLSSDSSRARRRAQPQPGGGGMGGIGGEGEGGDGMGGDSEETGDWDEEDDYWSQLEELEEGLSAGRTGMDEDGVRPSKRQRRAGTRNAAAHRIRMVIITSIIMISTNQKCNAIASLIGLFCHSTSAPELVIEVLSRMGLSISLTAIHDMINSLSRNSSEGIRRLAKTLLGAFAYDNFDMDFKSWLPTVEKPGSTLQHATSALIFPLEHGVTPDDLKCSAELWKSDPLNPHIPAHERRPRRTWADCLPPPRPSGTHGPDLHTRILAWHFRHALVTHCAAFEHFRDKLGMPETILQIPVMKTTHVPCRAMDINQSTHDGQAQIIENLLKQANLGDPTDFPGVQDLDEQVLLFHGDLGTGERIQGIKQSRSIEEKGVRRLQFVVFVLGLFHLQMACADAIWRMYIEPKELRTDPNGLYQHMCKIRPHDSGRIGSKPGFRLMHDLIHQCAPARMLDVWTVEASKRNTEHSTLEAFAASEPSWEELEALRRGRTCSRQYCIRFSRSALRSFLCTKYRATKVPIMPDVSVSNTDDPMPSHGRTSDDADGDDSVQPNANLDRGIRRLAASAVGQAVQSPLIELFRKVHTLFQDNFHLVHRSVRHAPPDVRSTIKVLMEELQKHKAHAYEAKRTVDVKLTDHLREGMYILQTTTGIIRDQTDMEVDEDEDQAGDADEDDDDMEVDIEDLEVMDEP